MNTKRNKTSKLFQIIPAIILIAMILAAMSLPVQAAPTGERLRNLAGPFLIGYASRNDFWSMSDATQYQDVARTEFNFLTPENAMKWDATESTQNVFTFSQADQHVAFAQTNNMKIHGHTLVWHSQLPGWVSGISGAANLTNVMYNHIDGVMNHWTDGTIYAWDVVNEAFNDDGTRRSSPFQNIIGNSFIELAFQHAHAADAQAKLIYNDYNIETVNSKSTAVYNMISDFKTRGIPIDGVGLQMHLTNGGLDYNSLASNMARFAALGVEIYITEMDVRFPTPLSQTDLQTQATIYGNVLNRCLAQPMCKALQVWGIPDKYSWVPSVFPGQGAPLIFDDNYNAKPAYYALQSELIANPRATATPCPSCPTATPTNTAPPTNTRTNTPIPSNTPTPCVNCTLKVQYKNGENPPLPSDNQVKPHIQILNTGTGGVALNTLKARYWFTRDTAQPQTFYCDFAVVGCGTVTQAIVQMGTPVTGADFYLEVGFSSGTLNAGGNTGEIQNRFNKNDWSNYNEADDWSYGTNTAYADAPHVTLYQSGVLVWGTEPGGVTPTNTPTRTPTMVSTACDFVPTCTPTPTLTATNTPVTPTNTPTATPTCSCPTWTPTRTNTPTPGPTATPTNTPVPSNTPTNTPVASNTPTNTPVPGGNLCATPTVITGGGSYSVPATGVCFKYVNAAFVRGAMWSVMNGSDSTVSNVVKWYGGRTETVTNCINDSQTLNGNGAQLNNFTVAKDANNAMFVTITTNKVNTVSMSIQNWQNGSGCSVAPTPQP